MHPQQTSANPRFSFVVAVYNVARYLPEFIKSIEAQTFDLGRVEVVMVDDGSTDNSAQILGEWQERRPELVKVIRKENGGQGSARNMGLTQATGEWVTFVDPDDLINDVYLAEVEDFLRDNPETEMVATYRLLLMEQRRVIEDKHPLRGMFSRKQKARLRNLDSDPQFFHGSAPAAFFRNERIRSAEMTFDERIRPNFEDGHFCVQYLFACPAPMVGFVPSARYLYRKRDDASSTLQNSLGHPGRFTDVLEYGYLDVLRSASELYGTVPLWLQNFFLYEIHWYFKAESQASGVENTATGAVADRFFELMGQILEFVDPAAIAAFSVVPFKTEWRDMLLHSFNDEQWHASYAVNSQTSERDKLARIVYHYVGDAPGERFFSNGVGIEPRHAKHRTVRMFDRVLMMQRIAWVSGPDDLTLELDGQPTPILAQWPRVPVPYRRGLDLRATLGSARSRPGVVGQSAEKTYRAIDIAQGSPKLLLKSHTRRITAKYGDAWVLMDRIHDADDSGEHLFRYLRDNREGINAWFVLERDTADWKRLQADGYGDRMVAYGSTDWKLLMLNCEVLISSHADVPIVRPPSITRISRRRWKFVFLQHGIIKDDLSNWLNPKFANIFVTSTPNEYASIAGDDTSYVYTTKETKLTELPRFDSMLWHGQEYPPDDRDLVLIGPTWRNWLAAPLKEGSQRREISDEFLQSEYARNWLEFLRSDQLARAAEQRSLQMALLPHPNLAAVFEEVDLPEHISLLGFVDQDVRSYFARSAVFITDYSSMAFNTAYIERPVIYFQFDAELMFGGSHVGRRGYFDYETQGFGPVAYDLDKAIELTEATMAAGREPDTKYLERIRASFPFRDGRASERVTREIESMLRGTDPAATSQATLAPKPIKLPG